MSPILFPLLCSIAAAAPTPPAASAAWAEMSQVQALQAGFVQTQHRSILARPLEASGTLSFQRPDSLRWEIEAPAPSVFVLQGTKVGMSYPALGVTEQFDLADKPELVQLVQGMMVWLSGDLDAVLKDYSLDWQPGPPDRATLTPTNPKLQSMIDHLDLELSATAPRHVARVTIVEPDGDKVEIVVSPPNTDPQLGADHFQVRTR